MAEGPRVLVDFKGWVKLRLNFELKGIYELLGYTATLSLEVFTQRNFVADFIRLKLNFIKYRKSFLTHPLWDSG